LALGVSSGPDGLEPCPGTTDAAVRYGIDLAATAERAGFKGAAGEALVLELPVLHAKSSAWASLAATIVLVGTGAGGPDGHRRAGAKLARVARGRGPVTAGFGSQTAAETAALVEGYLLGAYQPVKHFSADAAPRAKAVDTAADDAAAAFPGAAGLGASGLGAAGLGASGLGVRASGPPPASGDLTLVGAHDRAAAAKAEVIARATALARDLVNWPSNGKNPATLADRAAALAAAPSVAGPAGGVAGSAGGVAARPSIQLEVMGPAELERLGLNAILAVGAAAWRGPGADPSGGPRLVLASHTASDTKGAPHLVIVGKGITFDSGGIDLKPASGQATMKTDMAGAATALAAVLAAADLGLATRVSAVLPLAQNSIGAASMRPGDVIEVYGGASVEVGDTDAEGRLVLADALAYAAANLRPDYLIDIATLTGAAKVALGLTTGAVMTRDDVLAARIEQAGAAHGEQWWRLPLIDDYREALTSENAELSSTGKDGWGAGAVTAGLFLERFAGTGRWAHLDVAGPARASGGHDWAAPGGTGFGVATLIALAERLA
jgi:leucyl aminopeptidase